MADETPLRWTTTPPDRPGWWWVECSEYVPLQVVFVTRVVNGPDGYFEIARALPSIVFHAARWAGPLPPPEEPT